MVSYHSKAELFVQKEEAIKKLGTFDIWQKTEWNMPPGCGE